MNKEPKLTEKQLDELEGKAGKLVGVLKIFEADASDLSKEYLVELAMDVRTLVAEHRKMNKMLGTSQDADLQWKLVDRQCKVTGYAHQVRELQSEVDLLRRLVNAGFDSVRVHNWMSDPNRKPAITAFTAGGERQAAILIETAEEVIKERAGGILNRARVDQK